MHYLSIKKDYLCDLNNIFLMYCQIARILSTHIMCILINCYREQTNVFIYFISCCLHKDYVHLVC